MTNTVKFDAGNFKYYHKSEDSPDEGLLHSHTHDSLELYCFISGDCVFYIEGSAYKLRPGDVLITRNGETHYLKLLSKKPYERIVLNFSTDYLSAVDPNKILTNAFWARDLGSGNRFSSDSIGTDILTCLLKIEKCCRNTYSDRLEITVLLASMLLEINRCFNAEKDKSSPHAAHDLLAEIIAYINENITADICVDSISDKFFICKSYLNRVFKSKTGFTVWEYIVTKRLILARECIINDMSASRAAEFAGFKDYSTFYRQFVKHYNCPPNAVKKCRQSS